MRDGPRLSGSYSAELGCKNQERDVRLVERDKGTQLMARGRGVTDMLVIITGEPYARGC